MQTRPAFGGNIMATIMCDKYRPADGHRPAPCHAHGSEKQPGRTGRIIRETCPIKEEDILVKVLEILSDKKKDHVDVAGAEFIVSGGRGMMGKENFAMLKELADELGGVVGASRSAVDAGWMPQERQVGQTGKTVRPKIYVACGISGAIQHLVGMQDSDVVIAINRDKDAPIFEVATYGIVGDLFQVIPAITNRLRELKDCKGAQMNHTAIFTILFIAATAIFCGLAWRRLSLIRLGKEENRFDNIPARIKEMLLFAFGQKKVLARPFGINHSILFWAFLVLLLANGEFIVNGIFPADLLPAADHPHQRPAGLSLRYRLPAGADLHNRRLCPATVLQA